MDQTPQPDHEGRERVGYPSAGTTHVRRNSVFTGTGPSSSPVTARRDSQRQVTKAQDNGSGEDETHAIAYDRISGPTPPGTPAQSPETPISPISMPTSPRDLTDDEILNEVYDFINEEMEPGGQHSYCFQHADERPPITPESLAELDMPRIINNPKLRHDVNFDRELHFRPNLDGSKGRQKVLHAEQYWKALEAEFVMHHLSLRRKAQSPRDEPYWNRIGKASLVRLPKIFAAIRDILKTLVPDHDQKAVQERLDVDHLMQQIRNGVCDLIDLGNWLAKMLKNHCAPMRDPLVDNMQKDIKRGAFDNKPERLVNGLRQLMNILEAMKLDVANHQIRHMRPLLIDDTINFQRRYNAHRIAIGKINASETRLWLHDNIQPLGCEPTPLLALARGLVYDVIYNDASSFCPQPFYLDSDRLRALRVELHSRIYHQICQDVLREMASCRVPEARLERACNALQKSVAAIVGVLGRFADRLENLAAEIVRVLLIAEGRHPPFDADLVYIVEQKLGTYLRPDSHAFRQNAMILADQLIPKIQARVSDYTKLSALNLQDLLVPPVLTPARSTMGFGAVCEPIPAATRGISVDPDEDITRRFTHIIALHWQVWADLIYLVEPLEKEDDVASDNGSDSTIVQSQANSPTVPIAQAVYAPGRKWLPVSVTVTDVPSSLPTPSPSPQPEQGDDSVRNGEQDQSNESPEPRPQYIGNNDNRNNDNNNNSSEDSNLHDPFYQ